MLLGEGVQLRTFEIEDADAAILDQHRDDQLRARILHEIDVARVLGHVRDEHRLLVERGPADEALAELHVFRLGTLAVAHRQLHLELA